MEMTIKFSNKENWFKALESLAKWITELLELMRKVTGNDQYYDLEMQRNGDEITLYLKPKLLKQKIK